MDYLQKKLLNELAGSFDLFNKTKIYKGVQPDNGTTHIHEESHRNIVSSTSFGHIQRVLTYFHASDKPIPDALNMNYVADKLIYTIEVSTRAHEGYAVWRQIEYGKYFSLQTSLDQLPELYKSSYESYKKICNILVGSDSLFKVVVARGIAECIFNTKILQQLSIESIDNSLDSYLSEIQNQPDYRLKKLSELLSNECSSNGLNDRLESEFMRLSDKLGHLKNENVNTLHKAMMTRPFDYIELIDEWEVISTDIIFKELKSLSIPFDFCNPLEIQEEIHTFHSNLSDYLRKVDFELFSVIKRDKFESGLNFLENIEYIPPEQFKQTLIPLSTGTIGGIAEALLKADNLYISEVGILDSPILEESEPRVLFTTLTESHQKNRLSEEKKFILFTVTTEQLVFFGESQLLSQLTKTISPKTIINIVEWLTAISYNFELPRHFLLSIPEMDSGTFVVSQSTSSSAFIQQLKMCKVIGISSGFILGQFEEFVYFMLELKNNLIVLLKCTNAYFNILKIHKYSEFELIKEFKAPSIMTQQVNYALSLIKLDLIGAFFHHDVKNGTPNVINIS